MKLAYEAYDRTGRRISDSIEASDAGEATESLRRQGLFVTMIQAARSAPTEKPTTAGRAARGGRRLKNLALLARQLHILVATGTTLVEALVAIERQTHDPAWKHVVGQVRERIEEGGSLSDALSAYPQYFDPITRSLIAAGEAAGKLPAMLDRIASLTRKQQYVRNSILGAMIYPALLITISVAVLVVMLTFVLPRFAELFVTLDVPLPPTTQMLVMLSDLLIGYWWAVLIGLVAMAVGLNVWRKTPAGRRAIDTLVLRFPQFGKITRSFATARIVRLMGILLDSYLPLLEVLRLVKASTMNTHYRRLLENAEEAVTRGEAISVAFNDPSLINPTIYEALRSGEANGQVGAILLNMADFLDEDNEVIIKALTSIIEPIILIVLGVLIGFVAVSLFLPLFDLTSMAGGGG